MKKIILFIILLIPINVFGISYTEYSDYFYTETFMENSDLCEVEEIKKYKYYYLEKDYTVDYYNNQYLDDYYIYRDDEYVLSDSISTNVKPEHDVYNLEKNDFTYYQEYQKVRYVILYNFSYELNLSINEIYLYDNNNKYLEFEVLTENNFIKDNINDNDRTNGKNINSTDIIILKLKEEIDPKLLTIMYVLSGRYTKTFSFDVIINNSGDINDVYYYTNVNGGLSSLEYYFNYLDELEFNDKLDDEIKKVEGIYESIDNSKIVKYETMYTYKDYLYRYYNYKKIYLDDYYIENDNYIKDEDNYITIYKCRCREINSEEPVKIIEVPKEIIKEVEVIKEIEVPVEVVKEVIKEVEVPIEVIKEVKVPVKVNNSENKEIVKEIKVIKKIKDKNMTKLVIILLIVILILLIIIVKNKILSKKNKF